MPTEREFEAAGLYDPSDDMAADRLALLGWLSEQGFSIDELHEAEAACNLGGLASDRRLMPGDRLDDDESAPIAGITADQVEQFATAFGFTPYADGELGLTKAEAEMFGTFHTALGDLFSEPEAMSFVRVIGSAMSRVADAAVAMFLTDIESPHLAERGGEFELAQKSFIAVGMLDEFLPLLDIVLRRHLVQTTERSRAATIHDDRRLQRYAVGFVDLVGFTHASQDLPAPELASLIRDFEGRAHDAVTAAGARLVKMIGDEVMFVSPDPEAICRVGRTLMAGFGTDRGEVLPRGGLAYGDVLIQGGDYYGDVVNAASRLADEAVPQELLVTEPLAEIASSFEFEPAGRRQLKGFADPMRVRSMVLD